MKDDGRGVGEPLNETQYVTPYLSNPQGQHYGKGLVVRGQHWLSFEAPKSAAKSWRPLMDRVYMAPAPFFGAQGKPFAAVEKALPPNLEIVTLAPWDQKTLLLRIAHQFGLSEERRTVALPLHSLAGSSDRVSGEPIALLWGPIPARPIDRSDLGFRDGTGSFVLCAPRRKNGWDGS
ncbi:unnamed protein product [Effrenium voratum]|uniref:Uncharacterized protein n=1 Tax=Effrenium voratum TaxID=2562239 RepID=A0AA36ISZ8_9DINO|nr:unnamed protein product [Effrenium voratum]